MAVDYRRSGHGHGGHVGRPMDGGDPRTPMAWQHRDINFAYNDNRYSSERETRQNGRHTGPNTPSTSSRMGKSAERRRDHSEHRGSSSERYSGRGRGTSRDREHSSGRRGTHRSYNRSQPSPSSTDGTTEETTETDSQPPERERERHDERDQRSDYNGPTMQGYPVMVGYPMVAPAYQGGYPGNMMISGAGSIRSVQSVPMLAPPSHTWDGEPCPVHHQHQHHHQQAMPLAALYGMGVPGIGYSTPMSIAPSSVPASVISAATVRRARSVAEVSTGYLTPGTPYSQMSHPGTPGGTVDERRSIHASMGSIPAGGPHMAHQLMPPMMRPPRVVVGENGTPSQLPTREPKKHSPLPSKDNGKKSKGMSCCSGNFVVIWIILGIITFGILLGIVLKFTVS